MKLFITACAAYIVLLVASCDQQPTEDKTNVTPPQIAALELEMPDTAAIPAAAPKNEAGQEQQPSTGQYPKDTWDKMIIKTGELNIEVNDYAKYNLHIREVIKRWGAYISRERENSSDDKLETVIVIKIPVQHFDDAMQDLSSQNGKLVDKQIYAEDVTEQYYDTRARMEAKKRIRLRYLDMLEKAKNMEEILQVEREINDMQEQIEAGEGRVKYLSHSSSYSTITLTFFKVLKSPVVDEPGFGKRVLLALSGGVHWFGELLIFLVTLWPLWIGLVLLIWVIKRLTGRKVRPV